MEIGEVQLLIQKYKTGEISKQEQHLLENWYARESLRQMLNPEMEDYVRIKKEMWAGMEAQLPKQKTTTKLWPGMAVAAAAIAAITLGVWFYTSRQAIVNRQSQIVNQNDIAPGKNTATLTLANGKTINLSDAKTGVIIDAELKYNDGSNVERGDSDAGQDLKAVANLTVSTPRGGQYAITLPDGTKVWLNAESSLKFPSSFAGADQRKVLLTGEAYFEVAKMTVKSPLPGKTSARRMPFVVVTAKQEVEVLGTHFNINSYANEGSTKTTLLEGSVQVQPVDGAAKAVTLKKDEQAVLNEREIKVIPVVGESFIDWKEGVFYFENEDIQSILRKISRWYDVDIEYRGTKDHLGVYNGTISRFDNISKVLNVLERSEGLHFKIEGKKIIILK